jgi:hypothetical protein
MAKNDLQGALDLLILKTLSQLGQSIRMVSPIFELWPLLWD